MVFKLKSRTVKFVVCFYFVTIIYMLASLTSQDGSCKCVTENISDNREVSDKVNNTIDVLYDRTVRADINTSSDFTGNSSNVSYVTRMHKESGIVLFGPGINGSAVKFPKNISLLQQHNSDLHGFNKFVSDAIGLHRNLGICSLPLCFSRNKLLHLPPVSVIVIFRDEYPSILLRTIYSILEHSSENLLKEIILVDDGSVDANLQLSVALHVANLDKVLLVENNESLGLMMARQKGIEMSTADYFITMDGHMEVCDGWLEPLLSRLIEKPNALVAPCVSVIDRDTFEVNDCSHFNAMFLFFGQFTFEQVWTPFKKNVTASRNGSFAPIENAIHQGMVLGMRKKFFMDLGGFDRGMKIWGTEQIELSVKVWTCGGSVELIPCSRVAHMFRETPWGRQLSDKPHFNLNNARFASVWLDGEQRDIALQYQFNYGADETNVSERLDIRQRLSCKPYAYFLDKVREFGDIFVLKDVRISGYIYSNSSNKCLEFRRSFSNTQGKLLIADCFARYNPQHFLYTRERQIRTSDYLFFVENSELKVFRTLELCHERKTQFVITANNIVHVESQLCLTANGQNSVHMLPCNQNQNQTWIWPYGSEH